MIRFLAIATALGSFSVPAAAQAQGEWYEQGEFSPVRRVAITISNPLDEPRTNSPVVIPRSALPMLHDVHELSITLVDPRGTPRTEPPAAQRALEGAHGRLAERGGRSFDYQLDDLDQDGLWDEMFFIADLAPRETRTVYAYLGPQQRGWNPHRTHAGIGSYMRHLVPFWESENVGWKLWYPTDIDVFAKRRPQLMSNRLYMENLDGYAVSLIDPALGSDIMEVADSFGGGGIGVFDDPADRTRVSRPRFTPLSPAGNFNGGAASDTRYAFSVVVNGPLRSIVRAKTMNWDSGHGRYELEQTYTAFAGQDYTLGQVRYTSFKPKAAAARFAVGVRKRPGETTFFQRGGVAITAAPETIRNPDDRETVQPNMKVSFAGTALIVRNAFRPTYVFSEARGGNHLMSIDPTRDGRFDYLLAAGWSEGAGPRTAEAFRHYVLKTAREFEAPVAFVRAAEEAKPR